MVLSATCYTIESMLASLGSDTERVQAATDLVSSVDAAFGSDASAIGEEVRMLNGLPKIVQALTVDDLEFQQMLLVVLGNLSSDAFDPNSSRTKMLLRDTDVVAVLIPLLRRQGPPAAASCTVSGTSCTPTESLTLYAAACLQNMCHDHELAVRALRLGAHPELLRAGQAALADAAALRSEYLQALRAVLTANRDMEAKLRGTDARIAAVRLQNDELEADLARAAGRQPPPAPATIDDRTVRECQRVARGWLGRRRALAVAVAVASGDPALL